MPPDTHLEHIKERLRALPSQPGCYIYRSEKGDVLYVGKAINLKNRVRSYFQPSAAHGARIARLVAKTCDIEWIVVDSEVEALVLECNLIKEHRPYFNVRLRDDKSYPYIIITKEAFPRVLFTRNPKKGAGRSFGPYTSAFSVRDTLQLLHRVFPLIPCGKSWSGRDEQKPCLYYHMNQCLAPCAGLASKTEYQGIITEVERFLLGKEDAVIKQLEDQMAVFAEELDFERAAIVRDKITALKSVLEKQKVLTDDTHDRDVIAVVKDDRGAAIQMLYIRGGRLVGQRTCMLDGSSEASPTEAVQEFVKQYYSDVPEVPREIILPVEIEERRIVEQWLRQRRGSAVTVEVPQGGSGMRLLDLAAQNAEQALKAYAMEADRQEEWAEQAMTQLAEAIGLPTPAARIEGYDISNIQGTAPVGSMVVVEDGAAAKDQYRRFKIKFNPESPNDFAMMNELILRRLRRALDGDEKFTTLPDLIMIDGGKGQLGAALKARDELGFALPMVGLAKKQEIIYVPHQKVQAQDLLLDPSKPAKVEYEYTEVILPLNSPGLLLLRRLRDEAHRFAISYHRKVREKRAHGSILDEIPGIGPRKRRILLRTFGSVEGIRRAGVDEIAAVPSLTKRLAEQIFEFLRVE
jgi:excinuclease ABC subunit C